MFGHNPYSSLAAETPLQILLSSDESIGVAFLRNTTEACAWTNNELSQVSIRATGATSMQCLTSDHLNRMKKLLAQ